MSEHGGFVLMYRRIQDHWIYGAGEPFSSFQAWVDLIMLAKYKDEKFPYRGKIIDGKRGCVYRSISSLAQRWNWGRKRAAKFLNWLESEGMVEVNATANLTTIKVVNYGKYQDFEAPEEPDWNSERNSDGNNERPNDVTSGGENSERPNEQPNERLSEQPSERLTYNNNNNINKENNTNPNVDISISAPADPDNEQPPQHEENWDELEWAIPEFVNGKYICPGDPEWEEWKRSRS